MKGYFVAIFLLASTLTPAQEITGDIRGIVHDPSGALINGATVQVINTDRNTVIRTLKTDADGAYVAPLLPLGPYKLVVNAPGFQQYNATNIVLNVSDRRVIDVTLTVGGNTQTVDVTVAAEAINLETATASGLMTGNEVRELGNVTRNYEQLVSLQPGVASSLASDQLFVGVSNPVGTSNQINFSINGNRPTQNNWTIDGADNVDRGANLTLLAYPSIDSIAEFNVLRSSYLPEHGRSSAGEITVITRSGTSQFHGSAYDFFRNDVLNANNFFANRAGLDRPELRWNDFGFTLGGPVYIPGVYNKDRNKTFFFYSQEWRRIITYNTLTSNALPTPSMLQGTMPVAVCTGFDANGDCTNQTTQITNIDPTAQAYITDIYSKIPALTNTVDNTLTWVGRNVFNYREENVRIDHNFGPKLSVFGRFLDDSIPTQEPGGLFTGLGIPGVANTTTNSPGRNITVHGTVTFTPTLLLDAGYAYSYGAVLSTPTGLDLVANSPDIRPTLPFGLSPWIPDLSFNNGQVLSGFGSLPRLQPQPQCLWQSQQDDRPPRAQVRRQFQLLHQRRKCERFRRQQRDLHLLRFRRGRSGCGACGRNFRSGMGELLAGSREFQSDQYRLPRSGPPATVRGLRAGRMAYPSHLHAQLWPALLAVSGADLWQRFVDHLRPNSL